MQDPNAQPAPAAPEQGGGDAAMQAMMNVKEVLSKLQEIAPKGFPPEAQKLLQTAAGAYDGFLQMILGGQQPQEPQGPQPAPGPQSDMAAGSKQAIPA